MIPIRMRRDQQVNEGCFLEPGAIVSPQMLDYPRAITAMPTIYNHHTLPAIPPCQFSEAQADGIPALAEALQGEEVYFVTKLHRTMETEGGFSRASVWANPNELNWHR